MIVEILDDSCRAPISYNKDNKDFNMWQLKPVFDKLALPLPNSNEVQKTFENGFNLFVNHYGCVIRAHARHKNRKSDYSWYGQIYHPRSLPPIGVVHFPEFNLQIMPGLIPYDEERHNYADVVKQNFEDTLGTSHDSGPRNLGFVSDRLGRNDLVMLDTIFTIFKSRNKYSDYLGESTELMLDRSAFISDLQGAFYKAWTNDNPFYMKNFWHQCRKAHLSGERLYAGWLNDDNRLLQRTNLGKGNFINKSLEYDARLQDYLTLKR